MQISSSPNPEEIHGPQSNKDPASTKGGIEEEVPSSLEEQGPSTGEKTSDSPDIAHATARAAVGLSFGGISKGRSEGMAVAEPSAAKTPLVLVKVPRVSTDMGKEARQNEKATTDQRNQLVDQLVTVITSTIERLGKEVPTDLKALVEAGVEDNQTIKDMDKAAYTVTMKTISDTCGPNTIFTRDTKLGAGEFGFVVKAKQYVPEGETTIKLAMKQTKSGETHEAAVYKALSGTGQWACKHILMPHGEGRDQSSILLQRAACTVADLTLKADAMSPKEVLQIACDTAAGVKEMHDKGISHQDLHLGNLFMVEEGQSQVYKIGDLGSAQRVGELRSRPINLQAPSPEEMTELTCGTRSLTNKATDVWALGCRLYQLENHELPTFANNATNLKEHLDEKTTCEQKIKEFCGENKTLANKILNWNGRTKLEGAHKELAEKYRDEKNRFQSTNSSHRVQVAAFMKTEPKSDLERLARRMMDPDPSKRPEISEVVECLKGFDESAVHVAEIKAPHVETAGTGYFTENGYGAGTAVVAEAESGYGASQPTAPTTTPTAPEHLLGEATSDIPKIVQADEDRMKTAILDNTANGVDMLRELQQRRVDVAGWRDLEGNSLLFLALQGGASPDIVRYLCEISSDVDSASSKELPAFLNRLSTEERKVVMPAVLGALLGKNFEEVADYLCTNQVQTAREAVLTRTALLKKCPGLKTSIIHEGNGFVVKVKYEMKPAGAGEARGIAPPPQFKESWKKLEAATNKNVAVANVETRFNDIICPAKTQIAEKYPNSGFEKIHANTVVLEAGEKAVSAILSQAPKDDQQSIYLDAMTKSGKAVLDLTNSNDRNVQGVIRYFPTILNRPVTIGGCEVTCLKKEKGFEGVQGLKLLTYQVKIGGETRTLQRLHFAKWPDRGSVTVEELSALVDTVSALAGDGPWIHCRAGVGRSGTLATCLAIKKLRESGELKVDPDELLQQINTIILSGREQRGDLFVQTSEQYDLVVNYAKKLL